MPPRFAGHFACWLDGIGRRLRSGLRLTGRNYILEVKMNRVLTPILAGIVALTMSAAGWPADQTTTQNPQAGPSDKPASEASDKSNRPEEQKEKEAYSAKLKECEAVSDAAQKQKCI